MKLWHLSDLHYTNDEVTKPQSIGDVPNADVAIVLGDVSDNVFSSLTWCETNIRPHMPVIYVPGNHDFYWNDLLPTSGRARQFARKRGIHYLDGDTVVLGGVRFTGATFWSDFELDAKVDTKTCPTLLAKEMEVAGKRSDFRRIFGDKSNGRHLVPADTRALHLENKKYFQRVLDRSFDGPTVVLTHFAVHQNSCDPRYRGLPGAASYLSDQSDLIARFEPDLWLHGHVHTASEYNLGKTKVACNPRGYSHESSGFKWDYVHEV